MKRAIYPFVRVNGKLIHEDAFYDGLTSGPWRETPSGPRNAEGVRKERAEVEYL